MASRKSPSIETATFDKITSKLEAFIAEMVAHANQTDESIGEMTQIVKDLAEQVKILRIAIDDIRCEIEWTMRNHAPPRPRAIDLPVTRVPKLSAKNGEVGPPQPLEGAAGNEQAADPERLF